jgi:hypothetical protein
MEKVMIIMLGEREEELRDNIMRRELEEEVIALRDKREERINKD